MVVWMRESMVCASGVKLLVRGEGRGKACGV